MINVLYIVLAYLFMEFVAWSNHMYIMHGFLWTWYADLHWKGNGSGLLLKSEM